MIGSEFLISTNEAIFGSLCLQYISKMFNASIHYFQDIKLVISAEID